MCVYMNYIKYIHSMYTYITKMDIHISKLQNDPVNCHLTSVLYSGDL